MCWFSICYETISTKTVCCYETFSTKTVCCYETFSTKTVCCYETFSTKDSLLLRNIIYQNSLLLWNILYKDSLLLWNILYKDSLLNGKENSVKPETLVNPETCHGVFCVMIILVSSQQTLENLKHKHLLNLLNQSISPEKTKCKDIFCLLCFMTCLSKHLQLY